MSRDCDRIRFGIPSLDGLLGTKPRKQSRGDEIQYHGPEQGDFGFDCPESASASLCLIGPHGTGKSVLALHLASRYLADARCAESNALVFYVSTDLSYPMANDIWTSFALDVPNSRLIPFGDTYGKNGDKDLAIVLQNRTPYRDANREQNLAEHISQYQPAQAKNPEVTFVDLSAASAGDDWGFIHRLIAVLNEPHGSHHLVIIDAVEGLETLVGEKDAFGETTSRRSRIAQMLRTAFRKCHLLFVVEEPAQGQRVPEEFVSDLVVRLRSIHCQDFDRRTVEVQKVRGQSHVRGQHPYVIRSGAGSFTGIWQNIDDPRVNQPKPERLLNSRSSPTPETKIAGPTFQAYVHVMHSLHNITRNITYEKGPQQPNPNKGFAKFGIPHLDSMLGRSTSSDQPEQGKDNRGIPCSVITALVGDAGTHKSPLGRAFLYQALRSQLLDVVEGTTPLTTQVGVLLTTSDVGAGRLADDFFGWARTERSQSGKKVIPEDLERKAKDYLLEHIICRRFPIHNQSSEIVMHMVQSAVQEAQKKIGLNRRDKAATRYGQSWRIRLVIDDFSILKGMYTAVREDPLFLPFLTFYLRREGVSTLIIDTHPGRPDREGPSLFDDELRALANYHLYTWRVPFHGESRIAISAIPSINPNERSRIRELRWDPFQVPTALPTVDRGLELYTGLEQADPRQVPLEVRLYAEDDAATKQYVTDTNTLLGDLFVPLNRDSDQHGGFAVHTGSQEYGYLQDFCNLQGGRALDHTLILQVDEFWAMPTVEQQEELWGTRSSPSPPLRQEHEYLCGDLDDFENDPRQLFRRVLLTQDKLPSPNLQSHGRRLDYFYLPDCPLKLNGKPVSGIDRVPFKWEFAFLLCRESAWNEAKDDEVRLSSGTMTVREILEQLPRTSGRHDNPSDEEAKTDFPTIKGKRASWREFLGACEAVSRRLRYRGEQAPPFEISTVTGESFSCLMLEVWASEILDRLKPSDRPCDSINHIFKKPWTTNETRNGLVQWISKPEHIIDLYATWLLLVDVLPLNELVNSDGPVTFTKRISPPSAVASHHWYKSACQSIAQRKAAEPMFVAGLPGRFSVRGDWFLGVAHGSKSDLLADRVLDILSSRRGNFTRLYLGLGLPVRIREEEKENIAIRTALAWKESSGNLRTVRYRDLINLGAMPNEEAGGFHWLWRSALDGYHRHSRILQRWNSVTILMWNGVKAECGPNWKSGFEIYDALGRGGNRPRDYCAMNNRMQDILKEVNPNGRNTWTLFRERCEVLQYLIQWSDKNESMAEGARMVQEKEPIEEI